MLVIENDWLKVNIATEGAEVRQVHHKKNGMDYMWSGNSAYWGRVSPVLFPIVGRLKRDRFTLDEKTYHMSQHGFLRDVNFKVKAQSKEKASFVFESEGSFQDVYPYEFQVVIHYTLEQDSLQVQWEVINESRKTMYFSIGGHPAFRIPLAEGETIEDYTVELVPASDKKVIEYELENSLVKEKGTVQGRQVISLKPSVFANDACIYSHIDHASIKSSKSNHGVEVELTGFPFVGLWSKYNKEQNTIAPFVCIEPWYGIADAVETTGDFKEKKGINQLEANQTFKAGYKMAFK